MACQRTSIRTRLFLTLTVCGVSLSGCATILSKSVYPVSIQSHPNNAYFQVKDHQGQTVAQGTTPQTLRLKAKRGFFQPAEYSVTYSAPGCSTVHRDVSAGMDGFVFGNLILGGIPGLLVDAGTGAMYTLPDSVAGSLSGGMSYSQNTPSTPANGGGVQPASHVGQ